VHANRVTKINREVKETRDPIQGMFPDSRRLLRNLVGYDAERKQFKVRSRGRNGYVWTDERNLPDVVVRAYKLDDKVTQNPGGRPHRK
jgi:hypothetical protein